MNFAAAVMLVGAHRDEAAAAIAIGCGSSVLSGSFVLCCDLLRMCAGCAVFRLLCCVMVK